MSADNLRLRDIKNAIRTGKVRRRFKYDPRGTRYEIIGKTTDVRKIGVICRIKSTGKLLFITVYAL